MPASQDLYDFYDEQLKHFRRYDIEALCDIARTSKFTIVRASHLGFFIYPAFRLMKLRNKRQKMETAAQSQTTMKKQIQLGGPVINNHLYLLMRIELALGKYIQYPVGIRCLLLLKKKIE